MKVATPTILPTTAPAMAPALLDLVVLVGFESEPEPPEPEPGPVSCLIGSLRNSQIATSFGEFHALLQSQNRKDSSLSRATTTT